ncbi:MAG TPA: hypothetical protein VF432_03500 [Thermoanaerobaculia bacterium]
MIAEASDDADPHILTSPDVALTQIYEPACGVRRRRRRRSPSSAARAAQLLEVSGVKVDFEEATRENDALRVSWSIVKDWSEASRYMLDRTEKSAPDMLAAVGDEVTGVLPWLKRQW